VQFQGNLLKYSAASARYIHSPTELSCLTRFYRVVNSAIDYRVSNSSYRVSASQLGEMCYLPNTGSILHMQIQLQTPQSL